MNTELKTEINRNITNKALGALENAGATNTIEYKNLLESRISGTYTLFSINQAHKLIDDIASK